MVQGERTAGGRCGRDRSQLVRKPPPSLAYRPSWLRDCGGRRVTVVGADGFIGSHVVALALAAGAQVRAVCLKDPWRIRGLDVEPELVPRWAELDPRDADTLVILAYEPPPSYEPSVWLAHELEVNTAPAVELGRRARRTVFASSADVYGPWHDDPVAEDTTPAPATPYAEAKLRAEEALGDVALLVRFATVYGPSEHRRRAVPTFITAASRGEPAVIYGDGSDVRDYVYVGNVAAAIVNACSDSSSGLLNLGSGVGRSTLDVLAAVGSVTGSRVRPQFEPRERAPSRLVVSSLRAETKLGFAPCEDFERALEEEARWLDACAA